MPPERNPTHKTTNPNLKILKQTLIPVTHSEQSARRRGVTTKEGEGEAGSSRS
jgi:hypothetical protein